MPQVDLTTMTGPQLRQLLDSSRRRGDAALSYTILQEMAARREAPAKRRAAEPHLVAVDLGEPMEADDVPPMPSWRPPAHEPEAFLAPAPRRSSRKTRPARAVASAAAAPTEPLDAGPSPPMETPPLPGLGDADPGPPPAEAADPEDRDLQLHAAGPGSRPAPRQPRFRLAAGLALGIPVGILLGWGSAWIARDALRPPARPAAAPIQTAALAPLAAAIPAPLVPSAAEPAPDIEAPPDPTVGPPPDLSAAPTPPANAQEPAHAPDGRAIEPPSAPAPRSATAEAVSPPEVAQPAPERAVPAVAAGCKAASTPADRQICGDPRLLRLQGELRRAYAEALDAHQDRDLLRQRQLAWRDARNTVSDPDRLARLYEERIRKLNAATAEARQQR